MHDGTGKRSGSTLTLSLRATVVGRAHTCDLVVPHLSISRRHAELTLRDSSLTVRDLESRNGTYVNERRIDSGEVRAGQLLRFGSVTFLIEAGPNAYSPDAETQSVSQARLDCGGGRKARPDGGATASLRPAPGRAPRKAGRRPAQDQPPYRPQPRAGDLCGGQRRLASRTLGPLRRGRRLTAFASRAILTSRKQRAQRSVLVRDPLTGASIGVSPATRRSNS